MHLSRIVDLEDVAAHQHSGHAALYGSAHDVERPPVGPLLTTTLLRSFDVWVWSKLLER